jgi:hypothetical protein
MTELDKLDLEDIADAVVALKAAIEAIEMGERGAFIFSIGFARGRLSRVTDRIDFRRACETNRKARQ